MRPNALIYGARYDKMMEAFGGFGSCIEDPKDLRGALDELMNFPGPAWSTSSSARARSVRQQLPLAYLTFPKRDAPVSRVREEGRSVRDVQGRSATERPFLLRPKRSAGYRCGRCTGPRSVSGQQGRSSFTATSAPLRHVL